MGNKAAKGVAEKRAREEFRRVTGTTKKKKKPLLLDHISRIDASRIVPDFTLDLLQMGVIFVMDDSKIGRISEADFMKFFNECYDRCEDDSEFEIAPYCTMLLYANVCDAKGVEAFSKWFSLLVRQNYGPLMQKFREYEGLSYLPREAVDSLHRCLKVSLVCGLSNKSFFDLMQQVAEEEGVLSLEDDRLDELVPVCTVESFAKQMALGFSGLMKDLCLELPAGWVHSPEKVTDGVL